MARRIVLARVPGVRLLPAQLARDVVVVGHAARALGVIDIAVALLRARIALALDRIAFVATWSVWEGIWSFLACRLQSARPAL